MSVSLPRLPRDAAEDIITQCRTLDLMTIARRMPDRSADTIWPAVGDPRIEDATLSRLRDELTKLARDHGAPARPPTWTRFDGEAADSLHRLLELSLNEASQDDAWTYLTCCWLLDIAFWRFGPQADTRRFLGDINRNTFRRLWWRSEILGPFIDLTALGEDELVNVMERPTLASDTRLARGIVTAFLAAIEARPTLPRMILMRETTKRILRRTPFIDYSSLHEHDLALQVGSAVTAAAAAIMGEPAPPRSDPANRQVPASPDVEVLTSIDIVEPSTAATIDDHPPIKAGGRSTIFTTDQAGAVAVDVARRTGRVTNEVLRSLLAIDREGAGAILRRQVDKGTLVQHGRKRGTYYALPLEIDDQPTPPDDESTTPGTTVTGRSSPTVLRRLLNRRG